MTIREWITSNITGRPVTATQMATGSPGDGQSPVFAGRTGEWVYASPVGGGSFPNFSGSGSPEGTQVAGVGSSYVDTLNGGLYFKAVGTGSTGWVSGGISPATFVPGSALYADVLTLLLSPDAGEVFISNPSALSGSGNALSWAAGSADGEQNVSIKLGSSGQFTSLFNADGSVSLAGSVATNPPDSHSATVGFGSVAVGVPRQNTLPYDVDVSVTATVTAAAGGSLTVGVGSSATPIMDPYTPALSAGSVVSVRAHVPAGYYVTVGTTGTITLGSPVTVCTPL